MLQSSKVEAVNVVRQLCLPQRVSTLPCMCLSPLMTMCTYLHFPKLLSLCNDQYIHSS